MSLAIDLEDTVAMITGISDGGIGAGVARRFAEAGADVALCHRGGGAAAGELSAELRDLGVRAEAFGAELTDEHAVGALFDAVLDRFGRLDALVNNAGIQPVVPLGQMTVEQWRSVIDTNTTSVFLCTAAAADRLGDGGSVTHIASIEGHRMAPGHAHYAASKAAVLMHARAAAVELGPRIRVNTVSPGLVERPGLRQDWPEGVARWEATAPLDRLGTAADVGSACAFLASPLASWITGADLVVDGGVSAGPTW